MPQPLVLLPGLLNTRRLYESQIADLADLAEVIVPELWHYDSIGAMAQGSGDRYAQDPNAKLVPEGIEGRVASKGPLAELVYQLVGGLRSGMGYVGVRSIPELKEKARFLRISPAGLRVKGMPMGDVFIWNDAEAAHHLIYDDVLRERRLEAQPDEETADITVRNRYSFAR